MMTGVGRTIDRMKRILSPPPNRNFSKRHRTDGAGLGPTSEVGAMEGLLVCQPVVATLMAFLSWSDWFMLRHVTHCWRDTVDIQLKGLKQLNVPDILGQGRNKKRVNEAESLLGFMAEKAPAMQSLVIGEWLNRSPPEVLCRFKKLKHLDMEGAHLDPYLMGVLEELMSWESLKNLKTIALPSSENFFTKPVDFQAHLQVLMGRLHSLESLTFTPFSRHPTLLDDLKNPEKLTSLTVREYSPLPMLQSLPRFINMQHLALQCSPSQSPDEFAALEAAMRELKALKHVDLADLSLSATCVQRLTELPHLEWLTATSSSLPDCIQWAQFSQLTCLELGAIKEKFVGYINQITTLNTLSLAPRGRVNFACTLPQLYTLCLTLSSGVPVGGDFVFDFHPVCCNLKNLTLDIAPLKLPYINGGLLKHNTGIKNLQIRWKLSDSLPAKAKAKSIAKHCKGLETLEFSDVHSVEALSEVAAVFLDVCPFLKKLKTNKNVKGLEKQMERFSHLSVSICSAKKIPGNFSDKKSELL